jgi:hypothetical protein
VIRGSCLCRGVTFELTEPPARASYCHCTRCQKRTGTGASAQAEVDPATLRLLTGEELLTGYDPGDGGWIKTFCSVCGSALFSGSPDGTRRSVRLGAFDDDPGVRPQFRQRVATAAVWEPIPDDGLPRYDDSNTAR